MSALDKCTGGEWAVVGPKPSELKELNLHMGWWSVEVMGGPNVASYITYSDAHMMTASKKMYAAGKRLSELAAGIYVTGMSDQEAWITKAAFEDLDAALAAAEGRAA